MAALYVAFAAVVLWLIGEMLMQRGAPVHWRALALLGFLALVVGVVSRNVVVIVVGVLMFAVGQVLVTTSVRRGEEVAWGIDPPWRRGRADGGASAAREQPRLHVAPVEEAGAGPGPAPGDVLAAGPGGPEAHGDTAAMPAVGGAEAENPGAPGPDGYAAAYPEQHPGAAAGTEQADPYAPGGYADPQYSPYAPAGEGYQAASYDQASYGYEPHQQYQASYDPAAYQPAGYAAEGGGYQADPYAGYAAGQEQGGYGYPQPGAQQQPYADPSYSDPSYADQPYQQPYGDGAFGSGGAEPGGQHGGYDQGGYGYPQPAPYQEQHQGAPAAQPYGGESLGGGTTYRPTPYDPLETGEMPPIPQQYQGRGEHDPYHAGY